jgi:hypothetical protein
MPCTITIDSVAAVRLAGGVGNSISGVLVSGTANGLAAAGSTIDLLIVGPVAPPGPSCECFTGLVQDPQDPFICGLSGVPVVGGNWQVLLNALKVDPTVSACQCGGFSLQLLAVDPNDQTCKASWGPAVIACPGCPSVVVDPPVVGACVDGVSPTALTIHVTPSTTQTYVFYWQFGDGNIGPPIVVGPGGTGVQTTNYSYAPGTYTAILKTSDPVGCPDISITVVVPNCPGCVPFTGITFSQGACDSQGNRSVTATATGGPPNVPKWQWDNTGLPQPSTPPDAPNQSTQLLAGGTAHVATVVVDTTTCFQTLSGTVNVGACECPTATSLVASPSSGTAALAVTFTATIANSAAQVGAPSFSYGDGSPADTTGAHTYTSAGTYVATVTVAGPPPCTPLSASTTVTVSSGNGSHCNLFCNILCDILLILALILLVGASVLSVIALCAPPGPQTAVLEVVAIVAAIVGLILLFLWGLLCARFFCKLLNVLSWIVSFIISATVVIAAIVAIFGSLQCALGWILDFGEWGLVLAVIGWISKISGCKIFQ